MRLIDIKQHIGNHQVVCKQKIVAALVNLLCLHFTLRPQYPPFCCEMLRFFLYLWIYYTDCLIFYCFFFLHYCGFKSHICPLFWLEYVQSEQTTIFVIATSFSATLFLILWFRRCWMCSQGFVVKHKQNLLYISIWCFDHNTYHLRCDSCSGELQRKSSIFTFSHFELNIFQLLLQLLHMSWMGHLNYTIFLSPCSQNLFDF